VLARHPQSRSLRCPTGPRNPCETRGTGTRRDQPSDLGGDKVLLGEGARRSSDPGDALRRGGWCICMLEHLPNVPPAAWRETAPRIAALEAPDVSDGRAAEAYARPNGVLTAPHLAHVFAPGTLAEVALHGESAVLKGVVLGAIDRLIVEDAVLAVDFKTNALFPTGPRMCPRVCCARWAPMPRCCARSTRTEKSPRRSFGRGRRS
jgi:ATP-dependent helicase/nuclease subunit A